MKIVPIFDIDVESENCKLWTVFENIGGGASYPVFDKLFNQWTDTKFVRDFVREHQDQLVIEPWAGFSHEDAIDAIIDEAFDFESELKRIEAGALGNNEFALDEVFEDLHKGEYALRAKNKNLKKSKPNFENSVLRLYAIRLEDGCYIITGGGIKFTKSMKDADLDGENNKLYKLQTFLKEQGITDKQGLIDLME